MDEEQKLGEWGEKQVASLAWGTGADVQMSTDPYHPTTDMFVIPNGVSILTDLGIKGAVQVKTKSQSTYRRLEWKCKVTRRVVAPREEHGMERDRAERYWDAKIRSIIFVERMREISPYKLVASEKVLICNTWLCEPRTGECPPRKGAQPVLFVYFDRGLMRYLGDTDLATELLTFRPQTTPQPIER